LTFKKYEEWRDGLPDLGWLNEVFPDNEQWQKFSHGVISMTDKLKDSIEIGELLHHRTSLDRFIYNFSYFFLNFSF
jgi:hypothetical protein